MSGELKRDILAVLMANAANLGLVKMSEACGVPYDVLAWTQEWMSRRRRTAGFGALLTDARPGAKKLINGRDLVQR